MSHPSTYLSNQLPLGAYLFQEPWVECVSSFSKCFFVFFFNYTCIFVNPNHQKAEMDVKTIMDTWTLQMGFPVVTIKRVSNSDKATATQKHFLLDPNAVVKESSPFK